MEIARSPASVWWAAAPHAGALACFVGGAVVRGEMLLGLPFILIGGVAVPLVASRWPRADGLAGASFSAPATVLHGRRLLTGQLSTTDEQILWRPGRRAAEQGAKDILIHLDRHPVKGARGAGAIGVVLTVVDEQGADREFTTIRSRQLRDFLEHLPA